MSGGRSRRLPVKAGARARVDRDDRPADRGLAALQYAAPRASRADLRRLRPAGLHPVVTPPALRASPVTTVRKTILVIDDDDSVRRVATRLLRREGHVVSDWASGEAALEMLAASVEPVDLLLTDTVMPGMNGIEAAARVLDLRPGIPVIFMSGYGQSVLDNARLAGSPSFVAKPFHADELIAAVREALGRGQQIAA